MKARSTRIRYLLTAAFVTSALAAAAYNSGPPPAVTGAPGESLCAQPGCHSSFAPNSGPGTLSLEGLPEAYTPGQSYTVTVSLAQQGQSQWGFQLTAKIGNNRGGELSLIDRQTTQFASSSTAPRPQYVEHTFQGTMAGTPDGPVTWQVQWQAPPTGSGPVTFYVAGNAANGNFTSLGDYIYTTSVTVPEAALPPPPPPVLFGDANGDATVSVADVITILRGALGIEELAPERLEAADVAPKPGAGPKAGQPFGDGALSVTDAIRVLRRIIGLEPDPWPG